MNLAYSQLHKDEKDQPHRDDGPAYVSSNGMKFWYIHGKRHRLDGPAVEHPYYVREWWINDFEVTHKITKWAAERDIDLNNLSDEDKFIIEMHWSGYKRI
jgi:hypothetical protein